GEPRADLLVLGDQGPDVGDCPFDVAADVLRRVELRLLREVADPDSVGGPRGALKVGIDAGHDLEQGRLAGAVRAEDADLRAWIHRDVDALEDLAARWSHLAEVLHRKDVLWVSHRRGNLVARPAGRQFSGYLRAASTEIIEG